MAGPEAAQVLSLIRATISSLKSIEEVHCDASDAESLPPAFPAVAKHLRVVYDALETAQKQIRQRNDDSTCGEMKPTAAECKEKASRLEGVFLQVVPSAVDKRKESYREAVHEASTGKDNRVEVIMKGIIEDVRLLLMVDEEMKTAAALQLGTLAEAMREVSTIPLSLPVENPASGIHNYGPGPQNVNLGGGSQYNNYRGQQFVGGTFHGFNPSHS